MTPEETLSRRERKKQETRQRLMEAALHLCREHGYDDTTVEQIAEAADVAKGTFFNYFETKDAILPALAEWRLRQLQQALLPEHGAPASPVARIKLALRLIADDPLINPQMAGHLFAAVSNQHWQEPHPVRAFLQLLAGQVTEAQTAGEIRDDLDPILIGGIIRAVFFQHLIMWHCGYRPVPLRQLLDSVVDLLLEGIAGPNWGRDG
jgi:AcrR family transcriptional regulator